MSIYINVDIAMAKFERKFFNSDADFTTIGNGSLGGKAQGLANISRILEETYRQDSFPEISVSIPHMTVLTTEVFDDFMNQNQLHEIASSTEPDHRIAHAFINSDFPAKVVGDLYALIAEVKSPLAIRSSSLLEDALYEPFAGIYGTKMIPNNQFDTETRFHKLIEAIKFVYASTFFKDARDYFLATQHSIAEEKMAVIIQEIVGKRHRDRFYPEISGVARSFNFYPMGAARPEDGIVSLALGLGKTIVDEGISWSYSPAFPRANPPYGNIGELMSQTQHHFWAVNMAKLSVYDPVKETEYLLKLEALTADEDKSLKYIASTYDPGSDRIYPGVSAGGTKIITFAPMLELEQIPFNDLIKTLLKIAEDSLQIPVEIEFAVTLDSVNGLKARFGFLQVRPMVVSKEVIEISADERHGENVVVASDNVLGNGSMDNLFDIIYVKPESFQAKSTRQIAVEIEKINKTLREQKISYVLIGFGRWGSSDPWLGIPANWGQISGARVIVESTLPEMNVDLSQGSHFFHNLSSFRISYFAVKHTGKYKVNWTWLNQQKVVHETEFVKHVKLLSPLTVKVDGRNGVGVIKK